MFTQFNPGTVKQIMQIHRKGQAVEGVIYYGKDEDDKVRVYRGVVNGRVKEDTTLFKIDLKTDIAIDAIERVNDFLNGQEERITELEQSKADKCFVIAMSIALG